jgi:hypothetical protein
MKIAVAWPTRGRPHLFYPALQGWIARQSGRHDIIYSVVVDEDDDAMAGVGDAVRSVAPDAIVTTSFANNTKIGAINAAAQAVMAAEHPDILVLAADDMLAVARGWDDLVACLMQQNFADGDGVLHLNDGYTGRVLNTLPIMGRKYWNRFGYVYHPAYRSLWCDNEFQDVSQRLGRSAYVDMLLIRHAHPGNDRRVAGDALYRANDRDNGRDKQTYEARKAAGFPLEWH